MFGLDQQIARLETLTCEMSRKLDRMITLLEQIAEQQEPKAIIIRGVDPIDWTDTATRPDDSGPFATPYTYDLTGQDD